MYLPRPYPDELIGSVISRGLVHTGLPTKKYLFALLGRKVSTLSLFLPSSIRALAHALALDAEEFLWRHTDFPYVTAFMPLSEINRLKNKTLQLASSREQSLSSLVKSVTQGLRGLKYCPRCCTEELEQHGESYWHRQHNLPAVEICSLHRTALVEVNTPSRSMAFGIGQPHHYKTIDSQLRENLYIASDLAIRAGQLFDQHFEEVNWIDLYRVTAYNVGYCLASGDIAGRQLAQDLHNHFGDKFLLDCACNFNTGAKSPWPALMLRPANTTVFSPTKHLLIQSFLASVPKGEKLRTYAKPGKQTRDYHQLDLTLSTEMKRVMLQAQTQHIRIKVNQLAGKTELWSTFRHQRSLFPLSSRVLEEFRSSETAERQTSRRPYWRKRLGLDRTHNLTQEAVTNNS